MPVKSERQLGHARAEPRHGRVRLQRAPDANGVGKAKAIDARSLSGPGASDEERRIGARRILGPHGYETEVPRAYRASWLNRVDDPRLGLCPTPGAGSPT